MMAETVTCALVEDRKRRMNSINADMDLRGP